MGYYIQTPEITHGKADYLVDQHGAERVGDDAQSTDETHLVCVVENGFFDAAAIVYDERERESFLATADDARPRTWLLVDRSVCRELCGDYADMERELQREHA